MRWPALFYRKLIFICAPTLLLLILLLPARSPNSLPATEELAPTRPVTPKYAYVTMFATDWDTSLEARNEHGCEALVLLESVRMARNADNRTVDADLVMVV